MTDITNEIRFGCRLLLLKSKQPAADKIRSARSFANGSGNIRDGCPTFNHSDAVNGICLHDEIRVSVPKLGLESGEEVILTLLPCDDDLDTRDLFSPLVREDEFH